MTCLPRVWQRVSPGRRAGDQENNGRGPSPKLVTDDLLYVNRNVGHWEGWKPVPGGERTQSAPGVADGVLVARRADGAIRFNTFDGPTAWKGWRDVPDAGRTPSAPAITRFGAGVFLFVRGVDNHIHCKSLG